MKNKKILKYEVNNQTKHLEKYLKPQWTWKTYCLIFSLIFTLIFIVIDLEINFIALFSDSSKYFGDILGRMLPPDFSNFGNLIPKFQISRFREIQVFKILISIFKP